MSPWSPTFEPLFAVLGAIAVWALRARVAPLHPTPARLARHGCSVLGIGLLVVSLNSPLETIAVEHLLLFHLLQNVIVSDWAPPLILIGLTPAMRAGIADAARRAGSPGSHALPSHSRSGSSPGTSSTSAPSTTGFSRRRCSSTSSTRSSSRSASSSGGPCCAMRRARSRRSAASPTCSRRSSAPPSSASR